MSGRNGLWAALIADVVTKKRPEQLRAFWV